MISSMACQYNTDDIPWNNIVVTMLHLHLSNVKLKFNRPLSPHNLILTCKRNYAMLLHSNNIVQQHCINVPYFLPNSAVISGSWPWFPMIWNVFVNLMQKTRQIWGIWKLRPAYSPEMPNLGQNRWCFVPCDLKIWWMTLENNKASLLCCFKLCATFHSHRWIQTGVTVRKHPIWVKFDDF